MEIAIPPGVQFGVPYPHHQLIFLSANPLPYLIWWCSKPCVYYPKTVSLSPSLQYLLPLSSHPLAALFVCLVALHLSTLNRILRNLQILPLSLSLSSFLARRRRRHSCAECRRLASTHSDASHLLHTVFASRLGRPHCSDFIQHCARALFLFARNILLHIFPTAEYSPFYFSRLCLFSL